MGCGLHGEVWSLNRLPPCSDLAIATSFGLYMEHTFGRKNAEYPRQLRVFTERSELASTGTWRVRWRCMSCFSPATMVTIFTVPSPSASMEDLLARWTEWGEE